MDRLDRLRRLIRYDDWANRETLASVAGPEAPPGKSLQVLAHVIAAEHLWLHRLRNTKPGIAVWPALPIERCRAELAELERAWDDTLGDLAAGDFDRGIAYLNSKGERWSSTVGDILNHVLLHSAYHRGQIAAAVRAAGREPAYTDFIRAAREGLLD